MKYSIIGIDFDATIATEEYPGIGSLIPLAKETINWLASTGRTIIIWSCREGVYKNDAIDWLDRNGIMWHYFNSNDPRRTEKYGSDSRKVGCDLYIDDKNLYSKVIGDEVDWELTRLYLEILIKNDE